MPSPPSAARLVSILLAVAAIGPRLAGTIIVMTLLGIFSGLMFVPLNALLQWRSPPDRRGAIIAVSNVLVYAGMFMASMLAFGLARAGIDARGTFLGASIVLGGGFLWALSLVPDAFLRFILVGLAHTVYRVRIVGRLAHRTPCGLKLRGAFSPTARRAGTRLSLSTRRPRMR